MSIPVLPSRWTRATSIAAMVAIVWIVIATIIADMERGFWEWLRDVFGHHWLGKGYIALAIMLVIMPLAKGRVDQSGEQTNNAVRMVTWTAIIGSVVLLAYFVFAAE